MIETENVVRYRVKMFGCKINLERYNKQIIEEL